MSPPATKERLLDAAELLFAERGYDATSLRELTSAAGANLAAVNYHFGSKSALFAAVVQRRVGPINAERIERLDALEARGTPPPRVEELVEALLAPALLAPQFDQQRIRSPQEAAFLRLMGRLQSESGEHAEGLHQVFEEVHQRFMPALARALPELSPTELGWRMFFLIGSMCSALADPNRLAAFHLSPHDREQMLAQLVAFSAAGLRAPGASTTPTARED